MPAKKADSRKKRTPRPCEKTSVIRKGGSKTITPEKVEEKADAS